VKSEFAPRLRCPVCLRDGSLELRETAADEREVREGELICPSCGCAFPVHRGVPELLHEPAAHILTEAAGLERFAEHMSEAGWNRDLVRSLPNVEHGYWYVQARSMHQLLTTVPFSAGESVLDIGSNTCWAANHFAERGLDAIALDIATIELQGLYTADYFIDDGHVFFERVLGSMDAIPLSSSSVDYVYCCEVLHHNNAAALRRTFSEIFRVLRPGGRLLMVNETLKTLSDPSGVHVEAVEQFEGNEHAHWALRYRWEATRAGLLTEVTEPHYKAWFGDAQLSPSPDAARLHTAGKKLGFAMRRIGLARRAYLAWLNHVGGGVSMNMIGTKPTRYVGRHEAMGSAQRVLRLAAASIQMLLDRLRGRGVPRIPRTPEQAAEATRRVA
jgi:SAM-dependent methyltransferase